MRRKRGKGEEEVVVQGLTLWRRNHFSRLWCLLSVPFVCVVLRCDLGGALAQNEARPLICRPGPSGWCSSTGQVQLQPMPHPWQPVTNHQEIHR